MVHFLVKETDRGVDPPCSSTDRFAYPDFPFGQQRFAIVATWWMLREIEAAQLRICDVIPHTNGIIGLRFDLQKNDCEGAGETVYLQCICGTERVEYCPTCALHEQVSMVQRRAGEFSRISECHLPLFPKQSGGILEKKMVVRFIEEVATNDGIPLKTATGKRRFGGHFFRILGATWLCERGIARERIMALGRWKSGAVDRYLRNTPLKNVFTISRDVAGGNFASVRGPHLSGVGCAGTALRSPLESGTGSGVRCVPSSGFASEVLISPGETRRMAPLERSKSEFAFGACDAKTHVACPTNMLVLSHTRNGRVHAMVGEVMGAPTSWESRCGWRFGSHGPGTWSFVPTSAGLSLCGKCFNPQQES